MRTTGNHQAHVCGVLSSRMETWLRTGHSGSPAGTSNTHRRAVSSVLGPPVLGGRDSAITRSGPTLDRAVCRAQDPALRCDRQLILGASLVTPGLPGSREHGRGHECHNHTSHAGAGSALPARPAHTLLSGPVFLAGPAARVAFCEVACFSEPTRVSSVSRWAHPCLAMVSPDTWDPHGVPRWLCAPWERWPPRLPTRKSHPLPSLPWSHPETSGLSTSTLGCLGQPSTLGRDLVPTLSSQPTMHEPTDASPVTL